MTITRYKYLPNFIARKQTNMQEKTKKKDFKKKLFNFFSKGIPQKKKKAFYPDKIWYWDSLGGGKWGFFLFPFFLPQQATNNVAFCFWSHIFDECSPSVIVFTKQVSLWYGTNKPELSPRPEPSLKGELCNAPNIMGKGSRPFHNPNNFQNNTHDGQLNWILNVNNFECLNLNFSSKNKKSWVNY